MSHRLCALTLAALFTSPPVLHAQSVSECAAGAAVYGVSTRGAQLDLPGGEGAPAAYIGDYVSLGICDLDGFMASAREQQRDVVLFVNGLEAGVEPSAIDYDRQTITFTLDRTAQNADLWKPVLYAPLFYRTEVIRVSAGLRGAQPLPKLPYARTEVEFHKLWIDWTTWVSLVLMLSSVVSVVWFAVNSDMLREGPASGGIRQPYSLGRVQMACWFLLLVIGYVGIWLVDGDLDTLTPSLLALAGISAGTGLTAAFITPRSVVRASSLRTRLAEELAALDRTITELTADLASLGDRPQAAVARTLLESRQASRDRLAIALATVPAVFASKGFWTDIVTDDRGAVALDRVQIVVWTLVLMGIFGYSVVYDLRMPEFSPTLLGLMGISSGTYLGFQLPAASGRE